MQRSGSTALYAGGLLLFVGFIAGSAIGIVKDQPSLGAILGVGVAAVVAALLWLLRKDRR
jgi:membrane protein DedA with SNARE-associated domain